MTHGNQKHGYFGTPTYRSWASMLIRVRHKDQPTYQKYSGLDLSVDPRWEFFENFLADMGERPEGTTLDRKDNSSGLYCKENCRWATPQQQAVNRRNVRLVTYNGKTQSETEWGRELGIPTTTLKRKLRQGSSLQELITKE